VGTSGPLVRHGNRVPKTATTAPPLPNKGGSAAKIGADGASPSSRLFDRRCRAISPLIIGRIFKRIFFLKSRILRIFFPKKGISLAKTFTA
jgi:hypothetical protein